MFILDTNVVSELRRPRPHGAVVAWVSSLEPAHLNVAGVTVGEIQSGVGRTREQDPAKAAEIEGWFLDMMRWVTVLPMTSETFRIWAKYMHRKHARVSGDAMIAATAAEHGLTVATRHIGDFEQFPVPLLNPFDLR